MLTSDIKKLLPQYLIHSPSIYTIVTDLNGNYSYVNDLFKQRFSFLTDDFIGKHSYSAIYEGDHNKCLEIAQECLENPDQVFSIELRKPNSNMDTFFWTLWDFSVFKNELNEPIGILCLGQDITQKEQTILRLKSYDAVLKKIAWEQSHTVRGPLANILGIVQVLQSVPNLPQDQLNQSIAYLKIAAEELDTVIKNIVIQSSDNI